MTTARLTDRIILLTRIVLILLVLLVLVGVVLVMRTSMPAPVEPSPDALQPATLSLPAMGARPDGQLVRRPLFWASRTPYTPPEEAPEVVEPVQLDSALDDLKLVGLVGSGDNALIIVQTGRDQLRRIHLNESIQGWELVSISSDRATFRGRTGDGALEEQSLPLVRVAVSSETDPSARARFAPGGSESLGEGRGDTRNAEDAEDAVGAEGAEGSSSDAASEPAEQSPQSPESGSPAE